MRSYPVDTQLKYEVRNVLYIFSLLFLFGFLACSPTIARIAEMNNNVVEIPKVKVDYTEAKVHKLMGVPSMTEQVTINDITHDVWYYRIDLIEIGYDESTEFTPVIFSNRKVIGVGWDFHKVNHKTENSGFIRKSSHAYPKKSPEYTMKFQYSTHPPSYSYQVIGDIFSEISIHTAFRFYKFNKDDLIDEMKKEARLLGADAVINIEISLKEDRKNNMDRYRAEGQGVIFK